MRIERFQIQGFKSIRELAVEGLADINVFFGMNNVGKSNMFQALELWHWVILAGKSQTQHGTHPITYEVTSESLATRFGSSLSRLGSPEPILVRVDLSGVDSETRLIEKNQRLTVEVTVRQTATAIRCEVKNIVRQKNDELDRRISISQLVASLPRFHIVHAARRLQVEQRTAQTPAETINDANLKQALFYAYLSSDIEQKKRLNAIKRVLAEPPYSLGELDIALDPATDRIEIGFVRPDGRLPIENLGSGAQQLILVLGQIFLNDYPIIAVEEPETNLSPQHQEHLMATLRTLMEDPAVKLQQLFVATHSPYLEFTDNFYDVTFDLTSGTQVQAATAEKYGKHFAITPAGPESGARLNSLNQVKLYEGVIQDLGLQRGDLVIFVRNEAGRWELRAANEVAQELQAVTNGNARP
ncbi:MAG: AAA family ATPase [Caldilineaceae bacterium]|nr:AAA family ATPase [Caldilineaceae bacterium]